MRKLTASLLAATVLAGGALTGAAVAAPSPAHHPITEARSAERTASTRHESRVASEARHGSASRTAEVGDR